MTKELLLIPTPTIRPSQSNYNAINHHTEQKNLSVTQEYINMWGKYHSSQLGKEFNGFYGGIFTTICTRTGSRTNCNPG